ncbi:MAG: hypothetical protein LKI57_02360 [Acetobacter lovaniensis]|nr:hypothetical protein [Acetobacter lovaniensis]
MAAHSPVHVEQRHACHNSNGALLRHHAAGPCAPVQTGHKWYDNPPDIK